MNDISGHIGNIVYLELLARGYNGIKWYNLIELLQLKGISI